MRTILAIGLTTILVSCGTTKETKSVTSNQNRGRSNVEATSTSSTKTVETSRTARPDSATIARTNRSAEMEETESFKTMYSDLDMTEDQVSRFEKDWKNSLNSWKKSNRNKVMNSYERIEYQDRILRDILNDSQFESYQEWVREQADRK